MKIVLHIGMHKTGSTSLQMAFNSNREEYCKRGIYYPPGQKVWPGHPLVSRWIFAGQLDLVERFFKTAIENAHTQNCATVLISAERFSLISPERFSILKKFGDVRIFCFLRSQEDYLERRYSQSIKQLDDPFTGSIFKYHAKQNMDRYLDYFQLMENWAAIFGAENVSGYSYDALSSSSAIYDVMHEHLGISGYAPELKNASHNVSGPNETIIYLSRLKQIKSISQQQFNTAKKMLDEMFKNSYRRHLTSDYRKNLMDKYATGNRSVSLLYLHRSPNLRLSPQKNIQPAINYEEDFDHNIFKNLVTAIS